MFQFSTLVSLLIYIIVCTIIEKSKIKISYILNFGENKKRNFGKIWNFYAKSLFNKIYLIEISYADRLSPLRIDFRIQ